LKTAPSLCYRRGKMREPASAAIYHAPAQGPKTRHYFSLRREPALSDLRWVQVIEGNWEFVAEKRALAGASKKP
ncbi:hypothetical protein, partial [Methyloceanibacter sp.]|uniref:hypothetical protein n=1 Tax=Methyloceanibacter sp. TaxID=1965321 RepID=UPI00351B18D5